MRIVMMALGSRGDVQPFAALAAGLAARGHDVRMLADPTFADLFTGRGVTLIPTHGDVRQDMRSDVVRRIFDERASPFALARAMRSLGEQYAEGWTRDLLRHAADADLILPTGSAVFIGASVAEALGKPCIHAYPQPIMPTRYSPSALVPPLRRPMPWSNLVGALLAAQFFWQVFRSGVNRLRREMLGLKPWPFLGPYGVMRAQHVPMLNGYSPSILPRPADWPDSIHVTGYWWLDHPDWVMPPDVAAFLAAGPPPVYIGFGSMMPGDPAATTAKIVSAVRLAGCRAVLAGGWGGLKLDEPTPDIFALDAAPHDRLLPHMAAVVHHGGAGTTAAGVRAGVPAVVVPFIADQFFWAWRLEMLGVSGGTIRHGALTADALAAAIRRCLDDQGLRDRAAALGVRVQAEEGLAAAVRVIEAMGQRFP